MNTYSKIVTSIFIAIVVIIFIVPILIIKLIVSITSNRELKRDEILDIFMMNYLDCEKINY